MKNFVLDANALMTFLTGRPGARRVEKLLLEAGRRGSPIYMSAVNWGEVVYSAWRTRGEFVARKLQQEVARLALVVMDAGQERATGAAELKAIYGLGYADCFAAELALELAATLMTADPDFHKLGKKLKVDYLPRHENSARN